MRRLAPWAVVWGATLTLTVLTSLQSLERYREFRSGWPWDLAYNNQWYWALVEGDQKLSIRPVNSWGNEGPSIWVRTHLDPIRLVVVPFYALWPGPETLIVSQNVILWWMLPAAFGLLLSESRSVGISLAGTALVPLTPLLWPLLWNDFREMELAIPFVLWAIHGFRSRHRGLAALGVVGLLASREEFGLLVASFAILPPQADEDIGTTYAWARAAAYIGAGWMLFAFFGFERVLVARAAPDLYLAHFGGPRPGLLLTGEAALILLFLGLGSWVVLASLAPRVAVLAFPWIWGLANGRWNMNLLADERWHHLRYSAPMVALVLAAGLVGFARLAIGTLRRRHGGMILAALWLSAALGLTMPGFEVRQRLDRYVGPISREEAREIWRWIDQVGRDDAVVSAYEVSAPLSSRRLLYSNRLDINFPRSYPQLGPEFRWAFLRDGDLRDEVLTVQGFEVVHRGEFLRIYRRGGTP